MTLLRFAAVLMCAFGALQGHAEEETLLIQSEATHELAESFLHYIQESVESRYVDEEGLGQLFAEDFVMVVNGTVVAEGIDGLLARFDANFAQVDEVHFHPIRSVVSEEGFVCQYDIVVPGVRISHVIGIFSVQDGRIHSMHAVVNCTAL